MTRRHTEQPAPRKLDNAAIAERLEAFASLLDLAGASYYTARAYRRAAELVRFTKAPVAELVASGRVRELRGIGPGIERRLRELIETGQIAELRELERTVAPELVGLGRYLGLSAKRSVEIGRALGIETADEFRAAIRAGEVRTVPGIGPKTEQKLLEALAREQRTAGHARQPLLISRARPLVEAIAAALGGQSAGDPRRWRDASEHLAVVTTDRSALERFGELPQIVAVIERNDQRSLGVTVEGTPVELIVAEPDRFGTELVRATGSPEYVAALEPLPDAASEEDLYARLGIPLCPPELREEPHRRKPPRLLELADIRGDLHCHTTWSDGRASVLQMAEAARERGYAYLAICDHTPSVGAVPGLSADAVRRQAAEIADANERLAPFRVLRGIECDIRRDGTLDLGDDVLVELDWVMASVHGGQRGSRDELTLRVTEAMRNPYVRAISHPKGRYIGRRPENALDLEEAFSVALETGTALEVNGLSDRLDLSGEHVREAIAAGVSLVASTDAHSVRGLENMELAVATARRGWATAANVLNTRPLSKILRRTL
jgi:DNA polymerase (family 10)